MKWKVLLTVGVLTASVAFSWRLWRGTIEPLQAEANVDVVNAGGNPTPVLVELFTSEGCSSCPPADKLLTALNESQSIKGAQVIALSEHVDYWNRLGWTDPFSSADFSTRQSDYAQTFGTDDIYTPQMIIDGRTAFVGSNASKARAAIVQAARSPKGDVALKFTPGNKPESLCFKVQVTNLPKISAGDSADVMLAITESGLESNVSRGENSGRKLAHTAVTRKLLKVGTVEGGEFKAERTVDLDSRWKREKLHAVAFVQERSSKRVLGATSVRLGMEP